MDEGISSTKAIPIRRSRNSTRGPVAQSSGLTARIGSGLWTTVAPARSLWLASLGGTSFAIRGATTAWSSLINEGAAVERWLRGFVPGLPPQS
jgi:hypothetical protein